MNQEQQEIRDQQLHQLLDRFVSAVERIDSNMCEQNRIGREGLALSERHLETQEQMAGTSKQLEDKLIDSMTPKKSGAR